MLTKEALDVLALKPGATPTEIKEAYRDLVKVWHPDRFGSDARLRQKAEDKLSQINDAYRVLQSRAAMDDRNASETDMAAGSSRDDASSVGYSSAEPVSRRGRGREQEGCGCWVDLCGLGNRVGMFGWIFGVAAWGDAYGGIGTGISAAGSGCKSAGSAGEFGRAAAG